MFKKQIYNWFFEYVSSFTRYDDNPSYALKFNHSLRVAHNAREVAKYSGFETALIVLAEIAGIIHDCGRFQQFKLYNTFNDKLSEDHADLSVKAIIENDILKNMNNEDRNIIIKTVKYHNKKVLPVEELSETELKICRLIRDADKLDIFRLMAEQIENPIIDQKTLFLNQSEEINYSAPILQSIRDHHMANLDDMKTEVDFRLIQLSWVFDINYSATYKIMKEQGYLHKLIESLPAKNIIKRELNEINNQIYSYDQ